MMANHQRVLRLICLVVVLGVSVWSASATSTFLKAARVDVAQKCDPNKPDCCMGNLCPIGDAHCCLGGSHCCPNGLKCVAPEDWKPQYAPKTSTKKATELEMTYSVEEVSFMERSAAFGLQEWHCVQPELIESKPVCQGDGCVQRVEAEENKCPDGVDECHQKVKVEEADEVNLSGLSKPSSVKATKTKNEDGSDSLPDVPGAVVGGRKKPYGGKDDGTVTFTVSKEGAAADLDFSDLDWTAMTPRERSAVKKVVSEGEKSKQVISDLRKKLAKLRQDMEDAKVRQVTEIRNEHQRVKDVTEKEIDTLGKQYAETIAEKQETLRRIEDHMKAAEKKEEEKKKDIHEFRAKEQDRKEAARKKEEEFKETARRYEEQRAKHEAAVDAAAEKKHQAEIDLQRTKDEENEKKLELYRLERVKEETTKQGEVRIEAEKERQGQIAEQEAKHMQRIEEDNKAREHDLAVSEAENKKTLDDFETRQRKDREARAAERKIISDEIRADKQILSRERSADKAERELAEKQARQQKEVTEKLAAQKEALEKKATADEEKAKGEVSKLKTSEQEAKSKAESAKLQSDKLNSPEALAEQKKKSEEIRDTKVSAQQVQEENEKAMEKGKAESNNKKFLEEKEKTDRKALNKAEAAAAQRSEVREEAQKEARRAERISEEAKKTEEQVENEKKERETRKAKAEESEKKMKSDRENAALRAEVAMSALTKTSTAVDAAALQHDAAETAKRDANGANDRAIKILAEEKDPQILARALNRVATAAKEWVDASSAAVAKIEEALKVADEAIEATKVQGNGENMRKAEGYVKRLTALKFDSKTLLDLAKEAYTKRMEDASKAADRAGIRLKSLKAEEGEKSKEEEAEKKIAAERMKQYLENKRNVEILMGQAKGLKGDLTEAVGAATSASEQAKRLNNLESLQEAFARWSEAYDVASTLRNTTVDLVAVQEKYIVSTRQVGDPKLYNVVVEGRTKVAAMRQEAQGIFMPVEREFKAMSEKYHEIKVKVEAEEKAAEQQLKSENAKEQAIKLATQVALSNALAKPLTLAAGYELLGKNTRPAQFSIAGSVCILSGVVAPSLDSANSPKTLITSLSTECRPRGQVFFTVASEAGTVRVDVTKEGKVLLKTDSGKVGSWLSLDGVSFPIRTDDMKSLQLRSGWTSPTEVFADAGVYVASGICSISGAVRASNNAGKWVSTVPDACKPDGGRVAGRFEITPDGLLNALGDAPAGILTSAEHLLYAVSSNSTAIELNAQWKYNGIDRQPAVYSNKFLCVLMGGVSGDPASPIGVLPKACRPSVGSIFHRIVTGDSVHQITISSDGTIRWTSPNAVKGTPISLEGIHFTVAPTQQWEVEVAEEANKIREARERAVRAQEQSKKNAVAEQQNKKLNLGSVASPLTFSSFFEEAGKGLRLPQYARSGLVCQVSGVLTVKSAEKLAGSTLVTLPEDCRPTKKIEFNLYSSNGNIIHVDVGTDGVVTIVSSNVRDDETVGLGSIVFPMAAAKLSPLTLSSGWSTYKDYAEPSMYMEGTLCVLNGVAGATGSWRDPITVLPPACRPDKAIVFLADQEGKTAHITVNPDGKVTFDEKAYANKNGGYINLAGIAISRTATAALSAAGGWSVPSGPERSASVFNQKNICTLSGVISGAAKGTISRVPDVCIPSFAVRVSVPATAQDGSSFLVTVQVDKDGTVSANRAGTLHLAGSYLVGPVTAWEKEYDAAVQERQAKLDAIREEAEKAESRRRVAMSVPTFVAPLGNGSAPYGSAYQFPQSNRFGDICILSGMMRTNGVDGSPAIIKLDDRCIPATSVSFDSHSAGTETVRLEADNNGTLSVVSSASTPSWITLNGIAFPVKGSSKSRPVELESPWVSYAGAYGDVVVTQEGGLCVVTGMARVQDARHWSDHIGTVPAECRPTRTLIFAANQNKFTHTVRVQADGKIMWNGGNVHDSFISLSNIVYFPTDGAPLSLVGARAGNTTRSPTWQRKDTVCSLSGDIVIDSRQKTVATLPEECRPKIAAISFTMTNGKDMERFNIDTDGSIVWADGSGVGAVSLDGLFFTVSDPQGWEAGIKEHMKAAEAAQAKYEAERRAEVISPVSIGLLNEAVHNATLNRLPQYSLHGDVCKLSGVVNVKNVETDFAQLPESCRPSSRVVFASSVSGKKVVRVDVKSDGRIRTFTEGTHGTTVSLDGITFIVNGASKAKRLRLASPWTGFGEPYSANPTIILDGKVCVINGMIRVPSSDKWSNEIGSVPTECRPSRVMTFPAMHRNITHEVSILPSGNIVWTSGKVDTYWLSLNNIAYLPEVTTAAGAISLILNKEVVAGPSVPVATKSEAFCTLSGSLEVPSINHNATNGTTYDGYITRVPAMCHPGTGALVFTVGAFNGENAVVRIESRGHMYWVGGSAYPNRTNVFLDGISYVATASPDWEQVEMQKIQEQLARERAAEEAKKRAEKEESDKRVKALEQLKKAAEEQAQKDKFKLPLKNGAQSFGNKYAAPQVADIGQACLLDGVAYTSDFTKDALASLPANCKPRARLDFDQYGMKTSSLRTAVTPAGDVRVQSTSNGVAKGWLSFSGIIYPKHNATATKGTSAKFQGTEYNAMLSFESFGYESLFIQHAYGYGRLLDDSSLDGLKSATWFIRQPLYSKALSDKTAKWISIESLNQPHHFLVEENGVVKLLKDSGESDFQKRAVFGLKTTLSNGAAYVTFESFAKRGMIVRQTSRLLKVDKDPDAADSRFKPVISRWVPAPADYSSGFRQVDLHGPYWTAMDGFEKPSYVLQGDLCIITGMVEQGSSWSEQIAVLGPECRPTDGRIVFNANRGRMHARVDIMPDGRIMFVNGNGQDGRYLSLSGIAFFTTQDRPLHLAYGWSPSSGYRKPSWRTQGSICVLSGSASGNGLGQVAELPQECRPTKKLIFTTNNNNYVKRIDVHPDGVVEWKEGELSHAWINFDGIRFVVGALSLEADVEDSMEVRWDVLDLKSGWSTPKDSGYRKPSLYKIEDLCILSGVASSSDIQSVVADVSDDCMPPGRLAFDSHAAETRTVRIDVTEKGLVQWTSGNDKTHWLTLDGIIYSTKSARTLSIPLNEDYYVAYGSTFADPTFIRIGDICVLQGMIRRKDFGETIPYGSDRIAQLPNECRPRDGDIVLHMNMNEYTARVDITKTGHVMMRSGSIKNKFISLSGVSFYVEPVQTVTGLNGWNHFGHGYRVPGFRVMNKLCVLSGLFSGGGANHITTLPADCRPSSRLVFFTNHKEYNTRMDVLPDGRIIWADGVRRYSMASLDGISFIVDSDDIEAAPVANHTVAATRPITFNSSDFRAYDEKYESPSITLTGSLCVLSGSISYSNLDKFEANVEYVDGETNSFKHCVTAATQPLTMFVGNEQPARLDVTDKGIVWKGGYTSSGWASLDGLMYPLNGTKMNDVQLLNQWVNYGKGYAPLRYFRQGSLCVINGFVRTDNWNTDSSVFKNEIARLPAECSPTDGSLVFNAASDAQMHRVDIRPDGSIYYVNSAHGNQPKHPFIALNFAFFPEMMNNPLTLTSNYAPHGQRLRVPSFKLEGNLCVISGVATGDGSKVLAHLPPLCRPKKQLSFTVNHLAYTQRIDVTSEGEIHFLGPRRQALVALDGISFLVARWTEPVVEETAKSISDEGKALDLKSPSKMFGRGYRNPIYTRVGDLCVLSGRYASPNVRQVAAVLPEDCRPAKRSAFLLHNDNGLVLRVDVEADGRVRWITGDHFTNKDGSWVDLDGISFPVNGSVQYPLTLHGYLQSYGKDFARAQYHIKDGICSFDGYIRDRRWALLRNNQVLFTVPEECRPTDGTTVVLVSHNDYDLPLYIGRDGHVTIRNRSPAYTSLSLSGISYVADDKRGSILPLTNGWSFDSNAKMRLPKWYKRENLCFLSGYLKANNHGRGTIAVVPEDCRPEEKLIFSVATDGSSATQFGGLVELNPNGRLVNLKGSVRSWLSLEGIRYVVPKEKPSSAESAVVKAAGGVNSEKLNVTLPWKVIEKSTAPQIHDFGYLCMLSGVATTTDMRLPITKLPKNCRPRGLLPFDHHSVSNAPFRLDVQVDGSVLYAGGAFDGNYMHLNQIIFPKADAPVGAVQLTSHWENAESNLASAGWLKQGNLCVITGTVKVPAEETRGWSHYVGQLPKDCWPSDGRVSFSVNHNHYTHQVDVDEKGRILWIEGTNRGNTLSLNGISYFANSTENFLGVNSGFSVRNEGYRRPQFFIQGEMCALSGSVRRHSNEKVIVQLPPSCRPDVEEVFHVNSRYYAARVHVDTAGKVTYMSGNLWNNVASLDGIMFRRHKFDHSAKNGTSPELAALSCAHLLKAGQNTDGVYWIDADGVGGEEAFAAYCDQTTDGGGWMLIHKNNMANGNDISDAGYNLEALKEPTLDDVAILKRNTLRSIDQGLHATFRVNATAGHMAGTTLYFKGLPYYTTDKHDQRRLPNAQMKLSPTAAWKPVQKAEYYGSHALCMGTKSFSDSNAGDEHICLARWCCEKPFNGFWLNGGTWANAKRKYSGGTAWVKYDTSLI